MSPIEDLGKRKSPIDVGMEATGHALSRAQRAENPEQAGLWADAALKLAQATGNLSAAAGQMLQMQMAVQQRGPQ